jgi:hypothetical protein
MKSVIDKLTGKKLFDTAVYDIMLSEGQEMVDFFIENLSDEEIKNQHIYTTMLRYEQHKLDGWNYYQRFRAGLVWEIDNGVLTVQQAFLIENYLSIGYDKIAQNGDWMTASYKLKRISLPTAHEFVRIYLNSAIIILDSYIEMNYPKR